MNREFREALGKLVSEVSDLDKDLALYDQKTEAYAAVDSLSVSLARSCLMNHAVFSSLKDACQNGDTDEILSLCSELKKSLLYFNDVYDIEVSSIKWSTLRFQRNNQSYKMLMNICYLIIDGMLLSTQEGEYNMADFIDDQHMHSLYESFIREYYRYHYKNEI